MVRGSNGKMKAVPVPNLDDSNASSGIDKPVLGAKKSTIRQQRVIGKAIVNDLKAAAKRRKANVFASRFAPDISAEALKKYLETKLSLQIKVEKLDCRHPNSYSSFYVSSVCEDPKVFMAEDVWPEGIYVRWFKPSKNSLDTRNVLNTDAEAATGN